jgi:hypothetical protein
MPKLTREEYRHRELKKIEHHIKGQQWRLRKERERKREAEWWRIQEEAGWTEDG